MTIKTFRSTFQAWSAVFGFVWLLLAVLGLVDAVAGSGETGSLASGFIAMVVAVGAFLHSFRSPLVAEPDGVVVSRLIRRKIVRWDEIEQFVVFRRGPFEWPALRFENGEQLQCEDLKSWRSSGGMPSRAATWVVELNDLLDQHRESVRGA